MAFLSFMLAVITIIASLVLLAGINNAYSFNIYDGRPFNYAGSMENVSTAINDDNQHGEIVAETMDRVHFNFNQSMPNKRVARECNLFSGAWVHDASYPLYPAGQCPYLIEGRVNCIKNGRPDSDYEKWRWQPRGCSIPSEVLQLYFLIYKDYKASVEFLWDPFLIQQSITRKNKRILRLDSVGKNGIYWKGVDVLVFESSHWWIHAEGESWDLVVEGNRVYRNMDPLLAYRKGLTTWANWISANLDPKSSLVFFRTSSPKHESSSEWNERNGHGCYNQREPVQIAGYKPPALAQVSILKQVLKKTRFPVTLLDITRLTEFRKDGHPSIYSPDYNKEHMKNLEQFGDCSHWCLPGVPDTWNELLYTSLLFKGFGSG
eukprot:PITA_01151